MLANTGDVDEYAVGNEIMNLEAVSLELHEQKRSDVKRYTGSSGPNPEKGNA